jgi:hypothetical protein
MGGRRLAAAGGLWAMVVSDRKKTASRMKAFGKTEDVPMEYPKCEFANLVLVLEPIFTKYFCFPIPENKLIFLKK